jgi:hypothetical protein
VNYQKLAFEVNQSAAQQVAIMVKASN